MYVYTTYIQVSLERWGPGASRKDRWEVSNGRNHRGTDGKSTVMAPGKQIREQQCSRAGEIKIQLGVSSKGKAKLGVSTVEVSGEAGHLDLQHMTVWSQN